MLDLGPHASLDPLDFVGREAVRQRLLDIDVKSNAKSRTPAVAIARTLAENR
jgi:hypothetical protein